MICSKYARAIVLENKVLVYNSFYGGLIVLSKDVIKYLVLKENRIVNINGNVPYELLNYLEKKNIVYNNSVEELDNYRNQKSLRIKKANTGGLIKSLRFTLTKNCNCNCSYCYVEEKFKDVPPLRFDDCARFIDESMKLSKAKTLRIRFFGGEPTLEFELMKKIVFYLEKYYSDRTFEYIINTNAQFITDEMIALFSSKNFKVILSLDSIKTYNDLLRKSYFNDSYYDEAVKQIHRLIECEVDFVVNSVVTNQSISNLEEFVIRMSDIGVKRLSINLAKMVDDNTMKYDSEIAHKLFDSYKLSLEKKINLSGNWLEPFRRLVQGGGRAFCGGMGYELDLRPDCKVYSCNGEISPIADIYTISEIPNHPHYMKVINRVPGELISCNKCEIEGLCAGECASDARHSNGNYFEGNTKVCSLFKEVFNLLLTFSFDNV